ncbi:uncharacterized protein PAF06_010042 [Gastrophryne carolinensis]
MASKRLRIAVIGAGGAGLCSARHILSAPLSFEPPFVFEMTDQVGGTWVYTENMDSHDHVHSSMYRDLRTNLPKEIMEFPDFSFNPNLPSFIHHSDVLKYLEEYTDHFSIRPHIKFNTRVVSVTPVQVEGEDFCWDVISQTSGGSDSLTERFDAIMVCVGHYSTPFVPDIDGIEKFQGQVLHSHYYRFPEVFSSRSVVLLGTGPSGIDIAMELTPHAKQVFLCHRGPPLQWTPPENLLVIPPVVGASSCHLICEDGMEIMADTLIFCTGYKYSYPFLLTRDHMMVNKDVQEENRFEKHLQSNEYVECENLDKRDLVEGENIVGPDVGQGHLPPLYKHLIHAHYPTLCFIGACKIVVPFPLFHCQAQFFLSVLEGKCQLPPPEQMLFESRQEVKYIEKSGIPLKYLHRLDTKQWEYNQWLAETAGFEPLAPVLGQGLHSHYYRFPEVFSSFWVLDLLELTLPWSFLHMPHKSSRTTSTPPENLLHHRKPIVTLQLKAESSSTLMAAGNYFNRSRKIQCCVAVSGTSLKEKLVVKRQLNPYHKSDGKDGRTLEGICTIHFKHMPTDAL